MKIISLSILSILVSLSLNARENPFEPTDQFLEQKESIIKSNEEAQLKKEQEEKDRIAQEFEDQKMAELKIAEKMMAENKVKEAMEQKKLQMAQALKAKDEVKIEKKVETPTLIETKPYVPAIVENFKVLPFVKIRVENDTITIKVDPKYPLLNQDILKPVKKFLFDFKGNESFYTIRKEILSEDFQSFAVGTHMKENYFRVVINLTDEMINYTETIDSKNGIITIKKK